MEGPGGEGGAVGGEVGAGWGRELKDRYELISFMSAPSGQPAARLTHIQTAAGTKPRL